MTWPGECPLIAKRRHSASCGKDTGDLYPTLNQLNNLIAAGAENIWNGNWKYRAEDESIRSINDLRR